MSKLDNRPPSDDAFWKAVKADMPAHNLIKMPSIEEARAVISGTDASNEPPVTQGRIDEVLRKINASGGKS